jgi:hypothetical protein
MKKSYIKHSLWAVLILVLIFSNDYLKSRKLKNEHYYTIGKVYGFTKENRGGVDILFNFNVRGVTYDGKILSTFSKQERLNLLDKRFLVIFHPKNPGINSVFLDKPVKDSPLIPPIGGWIDLPEMKLTP